MKMNTEIQGNKNLGYVAYEYLSVNVKKDLEPIYTDCYENLGWQNIFNPETDNMIIHRGVDILVNLKFKRDRKMKNRSMLLSFQKKCEGALSKISKLEKSKETGAMIGSFTTGIIGLGLITGAIFGFLADKTLLAIVLALPGCMSWAFAFPVYKKIRSNQEAKVASLIEEQYDLVYDVCEQARKLLA